MDVTIRIRWIGLAVFCFRLCLAGRFAGYGRTDWNSAR